MEAQLAADRDDRVPFPRRGDQIVDAGHVVGQRLLDEDRRAGLDRGVRDRPVQPRRVAHEDGVRSGGQRVGQRREHAAVAPILGMALANGQPFADDNTAAT